MKNLCPAWILFSCQTLLAACGGSHSVLPPGDSLKGTWDLVGSNGDRGTFTWDESAVTIVWGKTTATILLSGDQGTGTWQEPASSSGISIQRSGDKIDTGAIPINLGGTWKLTDTDSASSSCSSKLTADSFTNSCTFKTGYVSGFGNIPTQMTAQRQKQADSVFGDLGGTWSFQADDSQCEATFTGGNITAKCTTNGKESLLSGTVSGSLASGSCLGFEFSAQRR